MEHILIQKLNYLSFLKSKAKDYEIQKLNFESWNTIIKLLQEYPNSNYFIGHSCIGILALMSKYFDDYGSLRNFLKEKSKNLYFNNSLDEDFIKKEMMNLYDENGRKR